MTNDTDEIKIGDIVLEGLKRSTFCDPSSIQAIEKSNNSVTYISMYGPDDLRVDEETYCKICLCAALTYLAEDPYNGVAAQYLPYAFARVDHLDHAIAVLDAMEKQIDLLCDNIWWEDPAFNKGRIYAGYGLWDKAIQAYLKSLERNFMDAKGAANFHLAIAYINLGQIELAKEHCKIAIEGYLRPELIDVNDPVIKVDDSALRVLNELIQRSGDDLINYVSNLVLTENGAYEDDED